MGSSETKAPLPIYMCTCPDCFTSPLVPRYGTARLCDSWSWPPYPSFPLLPLSFRFFQWTDAATYKESTGEPLRDTLMMPATLAAPSNYAQRSLEEGPDAEWQTCSQAPASSPLLKGSHFCLAVDAPRLLAVPSEAAR